MDLESIKKLIHLLEKSSVKKFNIKEKGLDLTIEMEGSSQDMTIISTPVLPHQSHAHPPHTHLEPKPHDSKSAKVSIKSPMVGTLYLAEAPDKPSYVKVGDKVEKGQTLCIIEAMKVMNAIQADRPCKIAKILVDNGAPVEFDAPLFEIEE